MKKFTKLFLSCAAVAAVTAAVATSAMAAENISATYARDKDPNTGADLATGTVSITLPEDYTAETKTLLILKPGADKTKVEPAKILQIDQGAKIVKATVPALTEDGYFDSEKTEPMKGTYTVLMGGTGVDKVYETTFNIGGSNQLLGDIDNNKKINIADGTAILKHIGGTAILKGDALQAADTDDNGKINISDGVIELKHIGGTDTTKLGTKTISDKTKTVPEVAE